MIRPAGPPGIRGRRMIRILHVRHEGMMVTIIVRDTLCGSKPPFDGCCVVRPVVILVNFLSDCPDHRISPIAGYPVPAKSRHKGFRENCQPGWVSDPGNLRVRWTKPRSAMYLNFRSRFAKPARSSLVKACSKSASRSFRSPHLEGTPRCQSLARAPFCGQNRQT
jgi:hypothetical protein